MLLDEDEDATQQAHQVQDYQIEVDFDDLDDDDRENGSPDALKEIEDNIAKINAEIEKMAPNMKAMDRLEDVEVKLQEAEKEAEKARKDSKTAREDYNDVKKRRRVGRLQLRARQLMPRADATSSIRPTITSRTSSTRCTKT
jgi:structural maintenance of chromosome 1